MKKTDDYSVYCHIIVYNCLLRINVIVQSVKETNRRHQKKEEDKSHRRKADEIQRINFLK